MKAAINKLRKRITALKKGSTIDRNDLDRLLYLVDAIEKQAFCQCTKLVSGDGDCCRCNKPQ